MMADAATETYDAALAAKLVPLATLANASLANLYLPSDWGLAYSHTGAASMGGCQYFLAVSPASSPTMCVLVLGALWSDFIAFYTPDNHSLFLVPSSVVGTTAAISADGGFETMYQSIRSALWADLAKIQLTIPAFATTLPLVVVGLGPGAPVAQLASLDLRPNKTLSPSPTCIPARPSSTPPSPPRLPAWCRRPTGCRRRPTCSRRSRCRPAATSWPARSKTWSWRSRPTIHPGSSATVRTTSNC
ncbi:hypothetical protein [Janthinobacterium sp.]|uniref:hypothetical protein n=1 Tax=Janthinobacterium sp. TaxID=1871054 RepID=UPI0025845587|nr:hypothetical protein [Janthinobacterium sp.]MCX7289916.1 hypothetical protein [Janthinobacterium sp.]